METTVKCGNFPFFRYTWPGNDESLACLEHAEKLAALANVMGFHLQFIPLTADEVMKLEMQGKHECSQNVKVKVE